MAKYSQKEYDEMWNRIISSIGDIDQIYSRDELRRRVDRPQEKPDGKNYALGKGNPAIDTLFGEEDRWGRAQVQNNLAKWTEDNIKPEDYLTDEQGEKLGKESKKAYTEEAAEKFRKKTERAAKKNITEMQPSEALKTDRKKAAEKITYGAIPEAKKYETTIGINQAIVRLPKPRKPERKAQVARAKKNLGRVKTFRRRGWYEKIMELHQKPIGSRPAEEELRKMGVGTSMKKGILARRVRNLTAVLRAQGYARQDKKRRTVLTAEGKRLLKRLKEETK